jgi:hypothetical protein
LMDAFQLIVFILPIFLVIGYIMDLVEFGK